MMNDKKEAAKELFDAGFDQKSIARVLDVSEKSISSWATKYNWKEKRAKKNMSREVAEDDVWELINYQTRALKMRKDQYEEKFKKKETESLTLLDKGDIDALQKLFTTIKSKQLEWATVVNIMKEFIDYVQVADLELAKNLIPKADDYLNIKRAEL
jgi:predicted transcriptional regulator